MKTYDIYVNGKKIGQLRAMDSKNAENVAENHPEFKDRWLSTKDRQAIAAPVAKAPRVNVTIEDVPPTFSPVPSWIKSVSAATAMRLVKALKGDDEFKKAASMILKELGPK